MTISQITAKEWRWATGWSIAILFLSCVPYLIAALSAPEGWQFAGFLVNPLDGHSYMAKMQQGAEGNWLFHLTYTPEPHEGAFIFTFYLALGHIAALTGLPKILIFHLARLLAGFGLLLTAFRFIGRLMPCAAERRLAFVFILSASGLGWLGAIFGAFPIDLWVPEAFVPYSLYANPHFPLAMMLMLIIFDQILLSFESQISGYELMQVPKSETLKPNPNSKLQTPKSILAALALAMILPFALLTVWAILVIFLGRLFMVRRRLPLTQIWPTLGVVFFSAPVIFYQYWVSTANPIMAGWGAQNITNAPKLLDFWLGYGVVGALAAVGFWRLIWPDRKNSTTGEWLVLIWAVGTVALVYFPFNLQRRLITGLHLPLCILAAIGLSRWLVGSKLKPKYQRLITMAAVTTGALGTLLVWSVPLIGFLQPPAESPTTARFFIRDDEVAAFEWLRGRVEPDDVILASPRVGMFVPGQTGARAFYGHPFETIQAKARESQAEDFYRGQIEATSLPVDFIIYGPSEKALGRPKILLNYSTVFSTGEVEVYKATK